MCIYATWTNSLHFRQSFEGRGHALWWSKKCKDCALDHQGPFQTCSPLPPVHKVTFCQVPVPVLQGLPYSKAVLKILVCSLWMNPYLPPPQSWVFHISRSSNGSIWINCLMEIKKLFVFCLKQTQLPWREDVKLLPNHPPANL